MKKSLVTLLLGMSVSTVAFAGMGGMNGAYVALDGGQSKTADVCNQAGLTVTSCSDTATAWRVAGGYNFTPMWGVELSYADLGKPTLGGTVTIPGSGTFPFNADVKATAWQFSGTGTFAINDAFSVLAKIGVVNSSTKLNVAIPGVGAAPEQSASKTTAGFGVGAQYNFNRNVGLRVQYEDLGTFGDSATTGTAKVTLISGGVVYHF